MCFSIMNCSPLFSQLSPFRPLSRIAGRYDTICPLASRTFQHSHAGHSQLRSVPFAGGYAPGRDPRIALDWQKKHSTGCGCRLPKRPIPVEQGRMGDR